MASHMVAYGTPGPTPKNRMVQLSAGLGIIEGVVIDQHFEQRGRIGRLLALVAQSPSLLGIGIDEDTCADRRPPIARCTCWARAPSRSSTAVT